MRVPSALLCIAALVGVPGMRAAATTVDHDQRATLETWLKRNPQYRPATESDCDCDEDIATMRKSGPFGTPIPDYVPYFMAGDFRKNGASAFAVLVVRTGGRESGGDRLLILDGPFSAAGKQPALSKDIGSIKHVGLFKTHGENYPLLGQFFSEGCSYAPKGQTYVEDCGK